MAVKNSESPTNSTAPLLSVVIACFNQATELELTLRSFLEQSLSHDKYELLIIDDHSPDLSARDIAADYRRQYPGAVIDYIRHYRANGGIYGSSAQVKNIGIRFARGKYIYFNNSEIVQAGQTLEYIAAKMENSPVPLCLRGRVLDLPYEDLKGLSPAELDLLHDRTDRRRERVATADHAGLAVVSRSILVQVGGIDERFDYWGKEDLDLAARLKRVGVQYVYDEQMKSFHIYHSPNHVKKGHYLRMCSLLDENNRCQVTEANVGHLWGNLTPIPASLLDKTFLVESRGDLESLKKRLEFLIYGPSSGTGFYDVWVVCKEGVRPPVESFLRQYYRTVPLKVIPDEPGELIGAYLLNQVRSENVAFMPEALPHAFTVPEMVDGALTGIIPWTGITEYPLETAKRGQGYADGWLCHIRIAQKHLASATCLEDWGCAELLKRDSVPWISPHAAAMPAIPVIRMVPIDTLKVSPIGFHSRVMAVVPHYKCEEWLFQCLESLVKQTRSLDAVLVVDDHSPGPPVDIVKQFPGVTLLTMEQNVGPYRIIQQVIDHFDFDAYLFQDADDWSTLDRLEILLSEAERTGAELIGSQELRVLCSTGSTANATLAAAARLQPVCYPLDVNRALAEKPGHPLLHPTSIVSKDLVKRVGGFATGLKFGGDTEFLLRAVHLARIVNTPYFCYFRRHRPGALTTDPSTGLGSPAREALVSILKNRARENNERRKNDCPLLLEPMKLRPPVPWKYLCGPQLL